MPADCLSPRMLGATGMEVSALSLGSWRTFERLPADTGMSILRAAREEGINFFDDARYNDETGTAPIPTGYSEVLFGELFRGAGVRRDEVVVANKLWWEFWPGQSAAAELDASLRRMKFDYVDLIYANPPPEGLEIADLVASAGALVASGKARAWALVNWQAGPAGQAVEAAAVALQPGPAVMGGGPRHDPGAHGGGCRRDRLVQPGGRGADRQVPVRGRDGPGGGGTERAQVRPGRLRGR
jgi:aryl-alcohol dehydrogenase-like predicted oxidoreductase